MYADGRMICDEKRRLLTAYERVTQEYSAAVSELNQTMGRLSKADYDALYRKTEALRYDVAEAQSHLQTHVTTHAC
jgi:hypothetical protein